MRSGVRACRAAFLTVSTYFVFLTIAHSQSKSFKVALSWDPNNPSRSTLGFNVALTGFTDSDVPDLIRAGNWEMYYRGSRLKISDLNFDPRTRTLDMRCACVGVPSYLDVKPGDLTFVYAPPGVNPISAASAAAPKST